MVSSPYTVISHEHEHSREEECLLNYGCIY